MLTLTNVQVPVKTAGSLSKPYNMYNSLRQGHVLMCIPFNLILEKMIPIADVNARDNIPFKSTQILAYTEVFDIIGRT